MSTPPDYGEPWTPAFRNSARTANGYDHGFMDEFQKRAIACVNACVGMADPAAEIEAMREAIKEAISQLNKYIHLLRSCDGNAKNCERVLAKLQPLIK